MSVNTRPSHRILPWLRQEGTVLLIALIMLLALTILGVVTMSTATLNERMSTHSVYRSNSLQAAESAVNNAQNGILANEAAIIQLMNDALVTPHQRTAGVARDVGSADMIATTDMMYLGHSPVIGDELGRFTGLSFEIRGTGTLNNSQATSTLGLGVIRRAPTP